jgi:hypothetical protein
MKRISASAILLGLLLPNLCPAADHLTVSVANPLPLTRENQTIELSLPDLSPLGENDLRKIHVQNSVGAEVLCQAVDTNYDEYRKPDQVVFQADFAPGETKTFRVSAGKKQEYTRNEFKAYGRFVRERFDDFAWENDRIAHRTYGKALETWKGEPLTSSAIDIWSKRVPGLVIDNWYMTDNYHADTGEGCDDYSAGASRGCGGTGLWAANQLWVSRNFVDSRVLANGPIRVMFELIYEPFDVNGTKVSEIKRITLDAGSQLDHFQCLYQPAGGRERLVPAIGFKKVPSAQKEFNPERGWLVLWEPMASNLGSQGLAAVVESGAAGTLTEDKLNHLWLVKASANNTISYWAGFAWDRAGRITTAEAWKTYVDHFAQELGSPLKISVSSQ